MKNIKLNFLVTFLCILILQPLFGIGSVAEARRKTPPKAFSFIAEGGKASQGECDGERKIPRLKRLKEYSKVGSYMGSELQSPEIKGRANEEMWKHFFKVKASCNTILAQTPSSVGEAEQKAPKADIPAEEDTEEEPVQTDGAEAPEAAAE